MKAMLQMMAGYNRWSNKRLYEAASLVSEAQYVEDRKVFFDSLHGTLNHLLVGDRIWMQRFTGQGDAPSALDAILFDTLRDLRQARVMEDQRIIGFINRLTPDALRGTFSYVPITRPERVTQPLAGALVHLFNHQAHHRGQAHCLLSQFGVEAPSLDLILYQRETGIGIETNLMT